MGKIFSGKIHIGKDSTLCYALIEKFKYEKNCGKGYRTELPYPLLGGTRSWI
jgi:hypothetical protein